MLAVNLHALQDGTVAAHLIHYNAPRSPRVESAVDYADGRHQVRMGAGLYTIVVFHPEDEAGR